MEGKIFDIQRCCVHDGPGIRTTVFFSGCNLRCEWCHNPESFEADGRLQFIETKCVGCGECLKACPRLLHSISDDGKHVIDRSRCARCGQCVSSCWAQALSMTALKMDVDDILAKVLLDKPFYRNKGGLTISGGEPLLQPEFAASLLMAAKENSVRTAVDTAGNVPFSSFERIRNHTDLFLYDMKCMDESAHLRVTGVSNALILENLKKLSHCAAKILVRIPVIPGLNDNEENMTASAAFLSDLEGVIGVELLRFHKLGGGKYESLGLHYAANNLDPPSKDFLEELSACFSEKGINVKVC
jgi:pyruvate formate lyase activating enzyme